MSPVHKAKIKNWSMTLAAVLPALGWGWGLLNSRFVLRTDYEKRIQADSTWKVGVNTKLDSANLRLQQIVCGRKLDEGCR